MGMSPSTGGKILLLKAGLVRANILSFSIECSNTEAISKLLQKLFALYSLMDQRGV